SRPARRERHHKQPPAPPPRDRPPKGGPPLGEPRHGAQSYAAAGTAKALSSPPMDVPLLVDDFLRRPVELYPEKIAIVDGAERFSYAEWSRRANQLARALGAAGSPAGGRVSTPPPHSH